MAELTLLKNPAEQATLAAWQAARERLPGEIARRDAAFARYAQSGMPNRRNEDWKYTDLRSLVGEVRPLAPTPDVTALARAAAALRAVAD